MITLLVPPSSPRGPLLSFSRSFAQGKASLLHLHSQSSTEGLKDDDFFLLGCSYADLFDEILSRPKGTSPILRSDWMTFLAVDQ